DYYCCSYAGIYTWVF
nr:immunoglobulin light chain junction region [Macaca mulatta]MOW56366.1 immunoglobulin light chain junction region [Macaca mulatta]MOW56376.1 immunoglobulin light chain junction region [Macaca mulatta]MOW56384.1 immunoglobulin light chain junction region [Macaca mulatta]MOW56388.1 immunoglobulin light chain junction region [Macaca mulatta]